MPPERGFPPEVGHALTALLEGMRREAGQACRLSTCPEVLLGPLDATDLPSLADGLYRQCFQYRGARPTEVPAPDSDLVLQAALRSAARAAGVPADRMAHLPAGWFVLRGSRRAGHLDQLATVRIYFSVHARALGSLVGLLAATLERAGLPFVFKCVDHCAGLPRRDAAVLYCPWRMRELLFLLVQELWPAIDPAHRDAHSPLFTRALAPGLAWAQDPPGGDSFGRQRCGVLAGALWHLSADVSEPGTALSGLARAFRVAGIDPARPECGPRRILLDA